jgi:hypothetical protein
MVATSSARQKSHGPRRRTCETPVGTGWLESGWIFPALDFSLM